MLEAIVQPSLEVNVVQSSMPVPTKGEVLIKVICSGLNPKDWKMVVYSNQALNSGDDIAGIIESVGEGVIGFRPGDRVIAFHPMRTGGGSFAEFAISPATSTILLPSNISFEEGSTIPLAAYTAAVGLYHSLELNPPWAPATKPTPLIIYGASSAVGAFAIKLARRSNIHPIIAIAGNAKFVQTIIEPSKGDVIVDYRQGNQHVISEVQQLLKKQGLDSVNYAFDCISEKGSPELLSSILTPGGSATFILPEKDYSTVSDKLRTSVTYVGYVHGSSTPGSLKGIRFNPSGRGDEFGLVFSSILSKGLQDGWFTPHPHEVVPNGLKGLPTALENLKEGKTSALKYAIRIGDTN